MSLLSIDIGSSAYKAVAFSTDGLVLARHSRAYRPEMPHPGHAEMRAETFWNVVCECCRETVSRMTEPVGALCFSSHGESFVPIDASGESVGPVILNQDGRAIAESEWIAKEFGARALFQLTGLISHPMYPAAKLLWLKKHRPDLFRPGVRLVTIIGYILARLGLEPLVDYSLASRYMAFDVRKKCWAPEILELVNIPENCLPPAVEAGTVAGALDVDAAAALGMRVGTKVVLGGHDQPCSALGLGAIDAGRVTDSMGTYECILANSDRPDHSDQAFDASLNSYCHVLPGKFATIAYFPSGIMLEWFHKLLESEIHCAPSYAELEGATKCQPSGLYITPNLIGTCNPDFNVRTKSVIVGLQVGTRREDIYQGILEGVACEFTRMSRFLGHAAGKFDDVYVTGGSAESKLGLRLRAAISGKKLHVSASRDAVCVGSAILAGVATGEFIDVADGVKHMVHEAELVEPDAELCAAYDGYFTRYMGLYAALAPFYE
ncbi:MAG: FGGY-family carbohydrate kinase [Terriglobales bacterium]